MNAWAPLEVDGKWAMVPIRCLKDGSRTEGDIGRLITAWNSMQDALLAWRFANASPFARASMYPRQRSRNGRAEAARRLRRAR
jgi:hypothetical protein